MNKYKTFFAGDTFDRGPMMFCNNATVTMDTDFGEVTTNVKDLKISPMDNTITAVKDRFEDYVRKDELKELIDIINSQKVFKDLKSVGESKKGFLILNYEKEIKGYELL